MDRGTLPSAGVDIMAAVVDEKFFCYSYRAITTNYTTSYVS